MNQLTWLFIGVMALSATGVTFRSRVDDVLAGIIGVLVWAYWSLGATNVEIVRDGHDVIVESYPGLALFGAGMVALHIMVLLIGTGKLMDVRGERMAEDVQKRP